MEVADLAEPWWKRAVIYQIYPRSFKDTNGDGIGDLPGVIEKLDYLQQLGVGAIWLTPIYRSPQKDNGYDISDYYRLHEPYGDMADFDRLVSEAHKRGLKIIMDIVVNHTSTEHEWFQQSRRSPDGPYGHFYIWKNGEKGQPPTNWRSKFGGSAWQFDETRGQYYLHLFDVTQADLNWEQEAVRTRLYEMMRFWLEKGVDGFRLDVINLISKDQRFPDDDRVGPVADGRRFYTDGPRIHEFLHEMNREVFAPYGAMTVGEMSSTTIEQCIRYSNPERQELDMTFSFHHLKVDYPQGEKWALAEFDFLALKRILSEWQVRMHEGNGWNALFWSNHDQPRVVSRYGDDAHYHRQSAKMLATTLHMMQGTPFIFQGEEIGMTNPGFERIDDYRDVETLNIYRLKREQGMSEAEILAILKQKSRDTSRTPMQWDASEQAGFTTGQAWINVAPNYRDINVANQLRDEDSILSHYQKLIRLRQTLDVITHGDYRLLLPEHRRIFAFVRSHGDERLLVVSNFYGEPTAFDWPPDLHLATGHTEIVIANYPDPPAPSEGMALRSYESVVYALRQGS